MTAKEFSVVHDEMANDAAIKILGEPVSMRAIAAKTLSKSPAVEADFSNRVFDKHDLRRRFRILRLRQVYSRQHKKLLDTGMFLSDPFDHNAYVVSSILNGSFEKESRRYRCLAS